MSTLTQFLAAFIAGSTTAITVQLIAVGIFWSEFISACAVCLSRVLCHRATTSEQILATGNRLDVVRIYAAAMETLLSTWTSDVIRVARMVGLKSFWNWPFDGFVNYGVGRLIIIPAVTPGTDIANPKPTAVWLWRDVQ